jgi:hypothetical protein
MKSLIYNNPIASSIIINFMGLILISYLLGKGVYGITLLCLPIAILNKGIIEHGANINYKKRIMIYLSVFIMVITAAFFTLHMHKMDL